MVSRLYAGQTTTKISVLLIGLAWWLCFVGRGQTMPLSGHSDRTRPNITTSQQQLLQMNLDHSSVHHNWHGSRNISTATTPQYPKDSVPDQTRTQYAVQSLSDNPSKQRQTYQQGVERDSSYTSIYPEQETQFNFFNAAESAGFHNSLEPHGYTLDSSAGVVQETGTVGSFLANLRGASVLIPALLVTGLLFFIPSVVNIDRMDTGSKRRYKSRRSMNLQRSLDELRIRSKARLL